MPHIAGEPDIGKRISAWRRQRGFTQVVIARRARIAPSYLSRIEIGRVHPTVRTASRIATALRMSLDDLLGVAPTIKKGRPCPASVSGSCLMDLLDTGHESSRKANRERYTPRQLRLLRRFSKLLQQSDASMTRALEVLMAKILKEGKSTRK